MKRASRRVCYALGADGTIDTEVHPPKILLVRGRAELDVVEGIPDEFLGTMNGTYTMTPEEAGVFREVLRRAIIERSADLGLSLS